MKIKNNTKNENKIQLYFNVNKRSNIQIKIYYKLNNSIQNKI